MVEAEEFLSGTDLERLRRKTYEYWCAAIGRLVPQGFHAWDRDNWGHDPDAEMIAQNGELGLGAHFSDVRLLLRGVLDALPDAREVVLDYSALVGSGYYAENELVCTEARRRWAEDQPAYGPIVLAWLGFQDGEVPDEALGRPNADTIGEYIEVLGRTLDGLIGRKGAFLVGLLAPYPSERMTCWPVSARVGNVKNNDQSLIGQIAIGLD